MTIAGGLDLILLGLVAYLIWAVTVCVSLVLAKRSPIATIGWMVSLLALPYVGAIVYLFFGPRRIERKRMRYAMVRRLIVQSAGLPETFAAAAVGNEEIRLRYRQLAGLAVKLQQLPPMRAETVRLFVDGDSCYGAIEAAIRAATDHVHFEYYIWEPGQAADLLLAALIDRARNGVHVRLLLDDVGSGRANDRLFAILRTAGGEIAWFNPVRLSHFKPTMFNFRTHRKIVVIDGHVGFTGGMNITDHTSVAAKWNDAWRDTHVEMTGAPVAALQRIFLEDWYFALGQPTLGRLKIPPAFFPPQSASAPITGPHVQIIASGPDETTYPIHAFYFTAIASARNSLAITTPYLVPDEALLAALKSAALRGVHCRLLVPKEGDSKLVSAAARSYFDELVRSGIAIFEYGPPMLHAKTMVVDHSVAIVGSANLDNRSFRLNFEVMAVIYDAVIAQQLGKIFDDDLRYAKFYHARRDPDSLRTRLANGLARLFSPIL